MTVETVPSGRARIVGKTLIAIAFLAIVVVSLLWLAGVFHRKIDDRSTARLTPQRRAPGAGEAVAVLRVERPRVESAVGTIRAVHETDVAAKILAKVVETTVQAGQMVRAGDVLVRLDDVDLVARSEQAKAALAAAAATRDQAAIEHTRIEALFADGQAAKIELDRARTNVLAAEADVRLAEQRAREAEAILDYATVRAPMDGKVVEKRVEVGDTAQPGETLVSLYDPTRMQLIARVRETLAVQLQIGETVQVGVDALKRTCAGKVSEIVPEAESASRSFTVKVTGPSADGVYSGMFGRLYVPVGTRSYLAIPPEALKRVGQLTLVDVVQDDGGERFLQRRAVTLGQADAPDEVEVLSGLAEGESVWLSD